MFDDDSDEGRTWAKNLLHTLKHEGYESAWEQLLTWRRALHSRTKKAEADRLIHYVLERRKMINYPEFQKRGWQIGSGLTTSGRKTRTTRRKGRGPRSQMPNAEAVAALTTLRESDQWNLFWPTLDAAKI